MVEFVLECIDKRENGVILEPRGHAKSTWANTVLLSWLIARNPNIRVGLMSNTAKQAYDFSRAIRFTLERNDTFKDIFGDLMSGSPKLTDPAWLRADSKHVETKDVTLFAQGVGGAILSKRFDIILCDDILDEENTINIEQQEKVDTWFTKTLRPCLVPGGVIIVIGTRWAEGDLYEKLMAPPEEGGKGWRSLVKGAIYDDGGTERALWPEVWTLEALQRERVEMGSAMFACAYLNDISGLMTGNVFRGPFQYFTQLPADHSFTWRMGVDLASSEKERADYTARVVTAEDRDTGDFYVFSVVRDKRETGHASFINDGYMAYPDINLVVCETNQFQSTLVQEVMRDYPRIPIEGKKADVDKVTRARAVSAKYEAHRVFHHASMAGSEFERELLSFPKGHDDMVDALGLSMDLGGGGVFFGSLRR